MAVLKYFIKKMLLFSLPFNILLVSYLSLDPFKVLYNYDNYYENTYISKNRDFISSEMYINNMQQYKYDSFIFGASTALFIPPSNWGKFIETSNCIFSFDASNENIVGIWSKIKFINKSNNHLKNALLIFDTGVTFSKFNNTGHIFMKHFKVYPSSEFNFHYQSFMSFLNLNLLIALVHYNISHKFYPYMTGLLDDRSISFDLVTNEISFTKVINELREDSLGYYENRTKMFTPRNRNVVSMEPQINPDQIRMLHEIRDIFEIDSTCFKILISPLYDQIAFNKSDLEILNMIFGEENVHDFSGINGFTEKVSNYYDRAHFKQYVGASLLNEIYK